MSNPYLLEGKKAFVTGGKRRIGRGIALALAEAGCDVGINDLTLDQDGEETLRLIRAYGREAEFFEGDISDASQVVRMFVLYLQRFGRIDILINNAGMFSVVPMSRVGFEEISRDEWTKMMDVNVAGTWLACKAVVPEMRKNGYGKIINISSGTIFGGNANRAHYVASKSGVVGLTRNLARELGEFGICVNTVSPGSTLTEDLPEGSDLATRERAVAARAIKRIQVPQDLVGAIMFLASPDSDFMTGQFMSVDGGTVLH